jgi:hypothetical protein
MRGVMFGEAQSLYWIQHYGMEKRYRSGIQDPDLECILVRVQYILVL